MKLRVHADDCGVSRGVTDAILRCIDEGPVEGTSLIANGAAFDYAVAALRARPQVALSVHLNLIEGPPVAPAAGLGLLVGNDGLLRSSFQSLLRAHTFGSAKLRSALEAQVRTELTAQVERVRAAVGPGVALRLDSHQHLHHLPFIFRIVTQLCGALPAAMRLAREPFFAGRHSLSGLAKHALLNALSASHRKTLRARGIASDDYLVGLLRTGRMTPAAVDKALGRLRARSQKSSELSVELLFHPGGAAPGEEAIWARYPALAAYYFSPDRRAESEALRSPAMAACLARWR